MDEFLESENKIDWVIEGENKNDEILESVKRLASRINELRGDQGKGVCVDDISRLVGETIGNRLGINCYPSKEPVDCRPIAIFISLCALSYVKKNRGHLKFDDALRAFIRHMTGTCPNKTETAIIVTDSWDPNIFDFWKPSIDNIHMHANVYGYFMIESKIRQFY